MKTLTKGLAILAKAAALSTALASASAAQVPQPDQARITAALEERGFGDVAISQNGANVIATATKDGQDYSFFYNSVNGRLVSVQGDERTFLGRYDNVTGESVDGPRDMTDRPGKSGDDHGKSGDDHGMSGDDRGKSGDDHGKSGVDDDDDQGSDDGTSDDDGDG